MITANTRVTALDILKECGLENAESLFGETRIRIGGIAGISDPNRLIKIQPGTEVIEVIVGTDIYDLELAKGNKEDNENIFTISEHAQEVTEEEGRQATEQAEQLQAVKELARKLMADDNYEPTLEEQDYLDQANEMVVAQQEANEMAKLQRKELERKKVKSK